MKTLIVFAGKYGMTAAYAREMAALIGEGAELVDLTACKPHSVSVQDVESLIIGSAVYAGQARSPFKKFIEMHAQELMQKRLMFFLCGLSSTEADQQQAIQNIIPETLRNHAQKVGFLPGKMQVEKMNFFERMILKMVEKAQEKDGVPPMADPDIKAEASSFLKGTEAALQDGTQ